MPILKRGQSLPVTGVVPEGFTIGDPEATAQQIQGGTADPRHGNPGEQAKPYPWEQYPDQPHGPYGIENQLLGMDVFSYMEPAGHLGQDPTADMTPLTHAAPWPKGTPTSVQPDAVSERRIESASIHSSNMGGSREALYEPTLNPVQDQWVELLETDPGMTFPQMQEIPSQIKGSSMGWGSRDRVQSYARQNGYGFDSAHMHRRYATGPIPGNFMWMEPGSRPLVKSIPGTAVIPMGQDSPFQGQDPAQSYDAHGAALMVLPTAYTAPPDPATAAGYPQEAPVGVDYW